MWEPGHTIQNGKYRVQRKLGGGGFGITYLAENVQLGRKVVIKVPNKTYAQDQDYEKFTRRFQREGQALAKIQHPNVVRVIDLCNEAGMPCLVMDYVAGESLSERVKRQSKLSQDEAVPVFREIAKTLQHLHKQGIIHCDLHPGNIILEPGGKPVLIDFGSAKFLIPTTFTVTTTVNENYAPYEQRKKDSQPEPKWDIYALAATLYFTVTGQKPDSAYDRKLFDDRLKSPLSHCPELSKWCNHAILQGMALEPDDRIASMQAWLGLLHPPQPTPPPDFPPTPQSQSAQQAANNFQFPWVPLLFLTLGYVPHGVIIFLGGLAGWVETVAVAWVETVAVVVAVAWAGAEAVSVAWAVAWIVSVAVAGAMAMAMAVAWAWAWAVAVAVAWVSVNFNKYGNLVFFLWFLSPLIGSISGTLTGLEFWIGLGTGLIAFVHFLIVLLSLQSSKKVLRKYLDPSSILGILGLFSTLGIAIGAGLGWWLWLSEFQLPVG